MSGIGLAATHHDPDGRLYDQMMRLLPTVQELYNGITIRLTSATQQRTVEALEGSGVRVARGTSDEDVLERLGYTRRQVIGDALNLECAAIHLCDFDRLLHWAEYYNDELVAVLNWLPTYDFVVLGRTDRAFASHPRVQRDTERIINFVYAQVSGDSWDVTAASRGLSRRAVEFLVAQSTDDTIGNDCTWPLVLRGAGELTVGYWPTDGLEYETADRYADEIAAAGDVAAWKARLDADPQAWERRLALARIEIAAMRQVVGGATLPLKESLWAS